eukprot:4446598-Amphidinium_carterae.1
MAASCVHATQTSVSLQDLRKVKTTLPTLTFNKSSAFQLVRSWKEWSLNVGLHMGAWHPEAQLYWSEVVDKANVYYWQWSSKTGAERTIYESQQLGLDVFGFVPPIPSSNPVE